MTASQTWHCWRCGADIGDLPRPYGRYARCPACCAELHVCRMCRHYDTTKAKHCRELAADAVSDKTHANACEWFQPAARAHATPAARAVHEARRELDALFGGRPDAADSPARTRQELDRLFGGDNGDAAADGPYS